MEYKIVKTGGFYIGKVYRNRDNKINAIDYVNSPLSAKFFDIMPAWYIEVELNQVLGYLETLGEEYEVFVFEYNIRRLGE